MVNYVLQHIYIEISMENIELLNKIKDQNKKYQKNHGPKQKEQNTRKKQEFNLQFICIKKLRSPSNLILYCERTHAITMHTHQFSFMALQTGTRTQHV